MCTTHPHLSFPFFLSFVLSFPHIFSSVLPLSFHSPFWICYKNCCFFFHSSLFLFKQAFTNFGLTLSVMVQTSSWLVFIFALISPLYVYNFLIMVMLHQTIRFFPLFHQLNSTYLHVYFLLTVINSFCHLLHFFSLRKNKVVSQVSM